MIIDLVFLLAVLGITILGTIFSGFSLAIPVEFQNSVLYFVSYINYLRGVLPVDNLLAAMGVYIFFETIWYTIKIAIWFWGHLPWVGKHADLPKLGSRGEDESDRRGFFSHSTFKRFRKNDD